MRTLMCPEMLSRSGAETPTVQCVRSSPSQSTVLTESTTWTRRKRREASVLGGALRPCLICVCPAVDWEVTWAPVEEGATVGGVSVSVLQWLTEDGLRRVGMLLLHQRQGLRSAELRACHAAVSDRIPNALWGGRLEQVRLPAHKQLRSSFLRIVVPVATAILNILGGKGHPTSVPGMPLRL